MSDKENLTEINEEEKDPTVVVDEKNDDDDGREGKGIGI